MMTYFAYYYVLCALFVIVRLIIIWSSKIEEVRNDDAYKYVIEILGEKQFILLVPLLAMVFSPILAPMMIWWYYTD